MSFYQKYELERLIADGETKTFRARETATGRIVFLHLFNPEGKPLLATLKSHLAKIPSVASLIELGDFAGSPFVVTEPITPFTNLREWLSALGASLPPAQPDAFTQLFGQPMRPEPPALKPPPPGKSDEFAKQFEQPAQPVKDREPGEFTRMFSTPSSASSKPAASEPGEFTRWFGTPEPRASQPAAPSAPRASEPDEFERLFGGSNAPAAPGVPKENPLAPPVGPGSVPSLETGGFTKIFGSGPSGEAINIEEEQARAARKAVPESRPFQAPSEFTKVFGPQGGRGSGAAPPQPAAAPTIGTPGASASGLFAVPSAPPPLPPPRPDGKPKTLTNPGEYTKLMAVPKFDAERNKSQPLAPPPSSSKRGLIIGLAIGVPALMLIVFLLVVYFTKT